MRKRRLSVFDENIVAEKANLVMRIANLKAKLDLLKYREPRIGGHKNIRLIVAAPRISEGASVERALPRQTVKSPRRARRHTSRPG
jgi:hypothetical protein